ncbi:MAG: SUMF1/EgtB/PvdO family nonheme iron enzyme [Anaerolineaceae bacterium]|nr:SUMF1/EgtB/PvdO family nonheme iron enzyme [Anaerolineaceae bacterium]
MPIEDKNVNDKDLNKSKKSKVKIRLKDEARTENVNKRVKIRLKDGKTEFAFPEMVRISSSEFLMGTSEEQVMKLYLKEEWAQEWKEDGMFYIEQPQHYVQLPAFEIGKYPVTNEEYYAFIWETNHRLPKTWKGFKFSEGLSKHPVAGISWEDAQLYCDWVSSKIKFNYRLPTEAEWERVARGVLDDRLYPWGDEYQSWRCNTIESRNEGPTSVDLYSPAGDSHEGVACMAGNVWEWTTSRLVPYPYDPDPEINSEVERMGYVVRGGAWYYSRKLARVSTREVYPPHYTSPALGFRLVMDRE